MLKATLEGSEPKLPVIYKIGDAPFSLSERFEEYQHLAAILAGQRKSPDQQGDRPTLAERFENDNWQQPPELYPLVCEYGKYICETHPQVAQILIMLMSKELEPLIKEMRPALYTLNGWQKVRALVSAMSAQLRGSCFGDEQWEWIPVQHHTSDPHRARGPPAEEASTEFHPAWDDPQLKVDLTRLTKQGLCDAIKFFQAQLDKGPAEIQRCTEKVSELRTKHGPLRVVSCEAYLGSEEAARIRTLDSEWRQGAQLFRACSILACPFAMMESWSYAYSFDQSMRQIRGLH